MVNICIAGHKGFIGSYLLDVLKKSKKINLILVKSNLLNRNNVEDEFSSFENINTLIFLVGGVGNNFNELFNVNTLTLFNLVDILKDRGLKNIIFTSTGGVYGEPIKYKSIEIDNTSPNSLYGLSKNITENVLKYFYDNFKISVYILRFPNVYGSGNRKGVIYSFLKSIKENNFVTFDGTGNEKRNFLYVTDAVNAINLCMEKFILNKNKPAKYEIINVSHKFTYSLKDLVGILKEIKFNNLEIRKSPKVNLNNIKVLSLDITKMKKIFKWEPKIDLKEGLIKVIKEDFDKL